MYHVRRLLAAASLGLLLCAAMPAAPSQAKQQPAHAPTYQVFATREGLVGHRTANGHVIQPRDRFVALPSWNVLSSKGGSEFQVRVSYNGRSVVLPVWDVGPWNTRDEYWSADRRHSDIPIGVPMAQAAFQNDYNSGRDERGRPIAMPNGIDIADGAFWDDLGMGQADWVEVTFLWLGEDPGPPEGAVDVGAAPAAPPEQIALEPGALAVDDVGQGYTAEARHTWYEQPCGLNGRHTWTYGTADPAQSENRATWTTALAGHGFYEAQVYVPACGEAATEAARYRVTVGDTTRQVEVNQSAAAGGWASLGVFHAADGPATVELSDVTGDRGRTVRFDAIKWLPRADATPPQAHVAEARPQADGSLLVRWTGADDASGIASYDVQVRQLPDGGWSDWQSGATNQEAAFVPPGPGSYAFRARARDWVGQEQPWPDGQELVVVAP